MPRPAVTAAVPPAARIVPLYVPSMPPFSRLRDRLEAIAGSGTYTNFGPASRAFEAALAGHLGVDPERLSVVTNATAGLTAALLAVAGKGELCAMPAWTHAATAAAARLAGLQPYFLDVDRHSWQLAPEGLTGRLAEAPGRVAAVVPVAPFGSRLDVPGWVAFQSRSGIPVVVDAAAGFDTWSDSGLTSVVSFHATKGFGIGEGGAVLSPDAGHGRRLRSTIALGMDAERVALLPGLNAKLDEFRAAIGLAALEMWPETRAALARRLAVYDAAIADAGLPLSRPDGLRGVVTSTYVVELPGGAARAVVEALAGHGVQGRRWWADGCHRAPAFAACPREDLTVTDGLVGRVLGLPLHGSLSDEDIRYVVACMTAVLDSAVGAEMRSDT